MSKTEEILKTRRDFYAFLCRMYLEEPARELADDLVNERLFFPDPKALELNEDLSMGFLELREFVDRSRGKTVDELQEELRDEYTRLFIGPHRLPVQPYESWWIDGKLMGNSLLKVKNEYRKAGIAKSRDYAEPEDHIAFELKFMQYLCEEEISTMDNNERIAECLKLQHKFLNEHLLQWVPVFCDSLYECELSDFFKGVAKITKGFILLDAHVIAELLEML
ncbi:MAG: TorD/DmsD family molecular chaperone [Candidatus Methanospirareceae archaeon]